MPDSPAYATEQDLVDGDWLPGAPPAAVDRFLRSATFVVARAANRNPYGDVPTGADVITLRDATCAQAASWIALGIDPQMLGIDGPPLLKRSEILTGKLEYDTAAHAKARTEAVSELAPEAETILAAGGLLWAPIPLANVGCLPSWGLDPVSPGAYAWPELDGASWPFQ
jgi:hypothetical protein